MLRIAAVATLLVVLLACAPAPSPAMKDVNYQGVVTFRLPSTWNVGDEPEGNGIFYDDWTGAGTLRLSVLKASKSSPSDIEIVLTRHARGAKPDRIQNGALLYKAIEYGQESGVELELHRWLVSVTLSTGEIRVLIFTHTILKGQKESDPRIAAELQMIDESVRTATYAR